MADSDQQGSTAPPPADKSRYIRTMAKDMASLAGTPMPARPAPAPKESVVLPENETPFFEKTAPRETPRETVALPSMQEAGNIVSKPTEESREAVLARLRQKVGESAQMNIEGPSVPPPARENEWPDIPTPPPSFAEPKPEAPVERLPPVTRDMAPPDAAAPLHTFASDFAEHIDQKGASAFSVLAAQQDQAVRSAPQALRPEGPDRRKVLVTIATGILLLLLAGGGIYATYAFVMTAKETPITVFTAPSILFADEYQEISGTGPELMDALARTADGTLVPGNVLVTYVTEPVDGEEGGPLSRAAQGGVLIRALELPAPDILLRNIVPESTVGVVSAGEETRAFFALRVGSYERTLAGMLTWEPVMLRDLAALYPLYPAPAVPEPEPVSLGTTTATSTRAATTTPVAIPVQAFALSRFADAIVANHDVRVLRDTAGRSLVLYGYADKQTLIIARDEAAFETLLARLKPAQ